MLPRIPKLPLICMQEIKGEEEFFLKPMDTHVFYELVK